jgi:MATE family multidrug resistance protein
MPTSTTRAILNLAWPMWIAQLAMMANAVLDTAMAGRFSAVDLAAVGVAASIMVTVLMSLISVLLALPPIIARLHGAGRYAEIGRELHQSVWVSIALAAVAMLLLYFPDPFIALSELQPAVELKVRAYLAASAWGVPAGIAMRLFFGLSSGIGRPRPVMVFNLFSLALKVPLNALFMYGLFGLPRMGGVGCAVATAVDAWLMALLVWGWCLRHPDYAQFQLRQRFTLPEKQAIVEFLKLGIPIGLTFVADVTAFTFMALFIARLGPVSSAAHQIAANLAASAFMTPLALGNAVTVLVGQALGANQPERARHTSWQGIRLSMSLAVLICLACWFGAPLIALLYTSDLNVQHAAIPLIMLVGLYHLGDAMQAVAIGALRGYQRLVAPMIIYTLALWGVGLGGGVALGRTDLLMPARGAAGFWVAAIVGLWLVAGLVGVYLNRVSRAAVT